MSDPTECGKCGGTALFDIPSTPPDHSHLVVGERLMREIAIGRRVCTDCGHVEEHVFRPEDLEALREELQRARAQAAGKLPR